MTASVYEYVELENQVKQTQTQNTQAMVHTLGHSPPSGPSGAQQGQPGSPQAATRQTPSMHFRLSPLGHSPPSGPSGAQHGQSRSPQAAPGVGAGDAGAGEAGAGEAGAGEAGVGEGDTAAGASVQMPLSHTRLSPCSKCGYENSTWPVRVLADPNGADFVVSTVQSGSQRGKCTNYL